MKHKTAIPSAPDVRRQCPQCGRLYLEGWRVVCPADGRALRLVEEPAAVPLPDA